MHSEEPGPRQVSYPLHPGVSEMRTGPEVRLAGSAGHNRPSPSTKVALSARHPLLGQQPLPMVRGQPDSRGLR